MFVCGLSKFRVPPVGKKMLIFVDDISQPEINKWGDQVTNEFFRSMIEMSGFYSLERPGDFYNILGRRRNILTSTTLKSRI